LVRRIELVADAYGTCVEKRNYGKTYWGVQRSMFIIDPEGTIAHVIERAPPKTHDDDVLAALADTQATAT
jgi:peroxiredoxin Q/BCP